MSRTTPCCCCGGPWPDRRRPPSSRLAATDDRDPSPTCVLGWIDALGPVIAARRPPAPVEPRPSRGAATRAWLSRTPWPSHAADLDRASRSSGDHAGGRASRSPSPPALAAGLARPDHPTRAVDPVHAVWETLRLTPPTWITARITTREVDLGGHAHPRRVGSCWSARCSWAGLHELVPATPPDCAAFDPDRWQERDAPPGRLAAVRRRPARVPGPQPRASRSSSTLARWGLDHELRLSEPVLDRPESGHRATPVSLHRSTPEGAVTVIEHARPAGHVRRRDR